MRGTRSRIRLEPAWPSFIISLNKHGNERNQQKQSYFGATRRFFPQPCHAIPNTRIYVAETMIKTESGCPQFSENREVSLLVGLARSMQQFR